MINPELAQDAFTTRAASLVVATTGSITLSASATGYSRTTGSFITDGLIVGMEVTPTGFTQTTPGIVSSVSALSLGIIGGRTAEASASGRSLDVKLPSMQTTPGGSTIRPQSSRQYLIRRFSVDTNRVTTFPERKGRVAETGLAIWQWYFIADLGDEGVKAMNRSVFAFKKLFASGTELSLSDGTRVHVRTDLGPTASDPLPLDSGHAVVTITVPWRAGTTNAIAA